MSQYYHSLVCYKANMLMYLDNIINKINFEMFKKYSWMHLDSLQLFQTMITI